MKSTSKSYKIRDWDNLYENSETKKYQNLKWLPLSNNHDNLIFRKIIMLENAAEIFTAWILLLQLASKMPKRGILETDQGPLTAKDCQLLTNFPERSFEKAFNLLSSREFQLIEKPDVISEEIRRDSEDMQDNSEKSGSIRIEKNRIELNNIYFDIKKIWNGFAETNNLATIHNLTKFRRKNIDKITGLPNFNFGNILNEIENSDFLLGRKNHWRVNFDFIFSTKNDCKNYFAILEGNYRNRDNSLPSDWQDKLMEAIEKDLK